jgi:hypothetical protein
LGRGTERRENGERVWYMIIYMCENEIMNPRRTVKKVGVKKE